MNEYYRTLYQQLAKEIETCESSVTDFPKHIECCFHICERISQTADMHARLTGFSNSADEILYYKIIRPKFRRLCEFYSLVYGAVLFEPEAGLGRRTFWSNEIERAENFLSENADFDNYIDRGETFSDADFFGGASDRANHYRNLIIQISARRMYVEFIRKRIGQNQ